MELAAKLVMARSDLMMACGGQHIRSSLRSHARSSSASSRVTGAAAAWMKQHALCCVTACCHAGYNSAKGRFSANSSHTDSSRHLATELSSQASFFTARHSSTASTQTLASNTTSASTHVHLGLQQERINSDGSLSTAYSRYRQQQQQQQHANEARSPPTTVGESRSTNSSSTPYHCSNSSIQQQQAVRPPGLPAAAPAAAPISKAQLDQLADMVQSSKRVVVVTGAGVSTESNIPDYRGPSGAYTTGFTPMTHQQFVAKPQNRSRYWARSFAGWHEFAFVSPNTAHEAIARLQGMGWLDLIITQNVDRLHHKGGSKNVLELHGTTHRVVCLDCGDNTCRHELQQRLAELNPHMAEAVRQASTAAAAAGGSGISNRAAYQRALRVGTAADARKVASGEGAEQVPIVRPDGDIELADAGHHFKLPVCTNCGSSSLKPDVVFFGDSVPKERVERAMSAAESADLVLVVGSSLMVWSAFRLIKAAKAAGARLAIVNVGPTRADELADLKVEALAGEVMMQLAMHPSFLVPRIPA